MREEGWEGKSGWKGDSPYSYKTVSWKIIKVTEENKCINWRLDCGILEGSILCGPSFTLQESPKPQA